MKFIILISCLFFPLLSMGQTYSLSYNANGCEFRISSNEVFEKEDSVLYIDVNISNMSDSSFFIVNPEGFQFVPGIKDDKVFYHYGDFEDIFSTYYKLKIIKAHENFSFQIPFKKSYLQSDLSKGYFVTLFLGIFNYSEELNFMTEESENYMVELTDRQVYLLSISNKTIELWFLPIFVE